MRKLDKGSNEVESAHKKKTKSHLNFREYFFARLCE